ncbi:TolC family protein [Polyangium sp. 6x1]|uniref:TolC family protein n=1 Tax=Polyangium sp. 6x1 TaxID=3042689 RepID=UPI002482E88F|nr:TolC family protein [Polyangium sp. 6x1]MDI1449429.1 TolC family protein [Polyangium sp. 6x1]
MKKTADMAQRSIRRWLLGAALSLGLAAVPAPAEAADKVVYDLRQILEIAERNHPNVLAARARLAQVRAQLDEAHRAPFSQFRMSGGVGLAPTVLGNNVFSPNTDVSLTSSLGLAWRASVDGVVPLWTFGKITNLWDAAEANVTVNKANVEKERDAVRLDVRRAYFGLQLARDGALLLKDVRGAIDKAVGKMKESIENDEGDPIELFKLQTYTAELEVREAESARYMTVALAGLRFFTGIKDLDIPDAPLKPPKHKLGHVSRYLTAARLYRPELAMARAGVQARRAQVEVARAQLFPDIGLGLNAGYARAPEVANQINPFGSDTANFFWYGAAVVFQWKLDFLPQSSRIQFAEAQLEEMRATEKLALGGAGVEVETAYAEVIDWQKRVDAYAKAVSYAKKWLVTVQQGIDVGTREEKDVLDPAKAYATNRFSLMNATMELDLAMSRLAKATGWDVIAPDGL